MNHQIKRLYLFALASIFLLSCRTNGMFNIHYDTVLPIIGSFALGLAVTSLICSKYKNKKISDRQKEIEGRKSFDNKNMYENIVESTKKYEEQIETIKKRHTSPDVNFIVPYNNQLTIFEQNKRLEAENEKLETIYVELQEEQKRLTNMLQNRNTTRDELLRKTTPF